MNILLVFFALIWPFSPGKPVSDAVVILENQRTKETVAWQQTGENGKVTFDHLDAGNYNLLFEFPLLEEKWIKTKKRHQAMTKATFTPKKRTYYYQGEEGYFSILFRKLKKTDREEFKAAFREVRMDEGFQYLVARFKTDRNGGEISVLVKKLTAKQFKRLTEKVDNDISTLSIPQQY